MYGLLDFQTAIEGILMGFKKLEKLNLVWFAKGVAYDKKLAGLISEPKGLRLSSRKIGKVLRRVLRVSKLKINEAVFDLARCCLREFPFSLI